MLCLPGPRPSLMKMKLMKQKHEMEGVGFQARRGMKRMFPQMHREQTAVMLHLNDFETPHLFPFGMETLLCVSFIIHVVYEKRVRQQFDQIEQNRYN